MLDAPSEGLGVGHRELLEGPSTPLIHRALLIAGGWSHPWAKKGRVFGVGSFDRDYNPSRSEPQRTPACSPRASLRPSRSMLPAAMKSLGLALLALLLCPSPGESGPAGEGSCP